MSRLVGIPSRDWTAQCPSPCVDVVDRSTQSDDFVSNKAYLAQTTFRYSSPRCSSTVDTDIAAQAAVALCECINTALDLDVINADTLVKVVVPLMQTVDPDIRCMGVKTWKLTLLARASKDSISGKLRTSVIESLYSGGESVRSGTLNLHLQLADATNVEGLLSLLLPHNNKLKQQINEVLDIDLIRQQ